MLSPPFGLVSAVVAGFVVDKRYYRAPMFGPFLEGYHNGVVVVARVFAAAVVAWLGLDVKRQCDAALAKAGTTPGFGPVFCIANTGPYAHCRNPLYLASLALPAALGLLADTAWVAIGSNLGLWLYFDCILVPAEERFLSRHLEGEYTRYCCNVKRWGWF